MVSISILIGRWILYIFQLLGRMCSRRRRVYIFFRKGLRIVRVGIDRNWKNPCLFRHSIWYKFLCFLSILYSRYRDRYGYSWDKQGLCLWYRIHPYKDNLKIILQCCRNIRYRYSHQENIKGNTHYILILFLKIFIILVK